MRQIKGANKRSKTKPKAPPVERTPWQSVQTFTRSAAAGIISIVKFVFVCFFVVFLSACATAKAPLPPVGISNVSHGDFKYSGEYLELPGEMRWINGIPYPYATSFTPEFTATLALVMAKRPELFERQSLLQGARVI